MSRLWAGPLLGDQVGHIVVAVREAASPPGRRPLGARSRHNASPGGGRCPLRLVVDFLNLEQEYLNVHKQRGIFQEVG